MNIFLKYKVIIIVTISILFQSCLTSGLLENNIKNHDLPKSVFLSENKSLLFKSSLELYGNYFSGILVIKPTKNNSFRIIFLNEVGMKFFDFELFKDSFAIHQIFDPLNKKILINLLEKDFRILIMSDIYLENSKFYKNKSDSTTAYVNAKNRIVIYPGKKTEIIEKVVVWSRFRKTIFIDYSNFIDNFPNTISLNHKNIKFAMQMELIKKD